MQLRLSFSALAIPMLIYACSSSGPAKKAHHSGPSGKYYNFKIAPGFSESLVIRKDFSFIYDFTHKTGTRNVKGKWELKSDTLLLYNYNMPAVISEVKQIYNAAHDSIKISFFMGEINGERLQLTDFLDVSINGNCRNKLKPNSQGEVWIERQELRKIEFNYGEYIITDRSLNEFTFFLNPLVFTISPKDLKNDKWLLKNDKLFKIDCETTDTLDYLEWVKDDKTIKERLEKKK
jgi:hypothetical protein